MYGFYWARSCSWGDTPRSRLNAPGRAAWHSVWCIGICHTLIQNQKFCQSLNSWSFLLSSGFSSSGLLWRRNWTEFRGRVFNFKVKGREFERCLLFASLAPLKFVVMSLLVLWRLKRLWIVSGTCTHTQISWEKLKCSFWLALARHQLSKMRYTMHYVAVNNFLHLFLCLYFIYYILLSMLCIILKSHPIW